MGTIIKFINWKFCCLVVLIISFISCSQKSEPKMNLDNKVREIRIMTLDPGHFHAALVQKTNYNLVSPIVHIYAPIGKDLNDHLRRINGFNSRKNNPTHWKSIIYKGPDYLEKMIAEKPGNVMITSGNNRKRTKYIKTAIDAGINVLADKPMCINKEGFDLILEAFKSAKEKEVLLYDIMTERSEITTILQKKIIQFPELFGEIKKGSLENPAVIKSSVHHFYKYVSGKPLVRPAWFFDSMQQGDGLVDVTTHLVDLVQWELFPDKILDYQKDIKIIEAKHWPTKLTLEQFKNVTKSNRYPDYLLSRTKNNILPVYSNGEINYRLKGINVKVIVEWKYKAPNNAGDTHYSIIRGSKSNIIIKQGKEQKYKPELYIEGINWVNKNAFNKQIQSVINELQNYYPGIEIERSNEYWHIIIPDKYRLGHEAHFGQVMERYLDYLEKGKLPEWEIPNMIAKYYTTTKAFELSKNND